MATMSADEQAAEDSTRERLLHGAIRLLSSSGPEALQARKVAAEIGASTMAVYTHFGGMPQLVEAMVREGFRRLDRRLAEVAVTEDPVADLFAVGLAYRSHALDHPERGAISCPGTAPRPTSRKGSSRSSTWSPR
jgi:AcrR family transcriptional regulator